MHHLPSSNLSIRIKTTNLVTNNISSNCKTVNISVQAKNIHGLKSGKCQGENLRCIPSRPGILSLIWQKPAWFQLQGNFVHIFHLNRLSWVRWPKKWSLRNPKLNEQRNVQPWTILNTQCLISIFHTKFSFFQNMWALWGKLYVVTFSWRPLFHWKKVVERIWPRSSAPNNFFRVLREKAFQTLPWRFLYRVSLIQHFDWHGQDFCKYEVLGRKGALKASIFSLIWPSTLHQHQYHGCHQRSNKMETMDFVGRE